MKYSEMIYYSGSKANMNNNQVMIQIKKKYIRNQLQMSFLDYLSVDLVMLHLNINTK